MAKSNDLYWIQRAKAGDISAFSHVVSIYQGMVYNVILRLVNNKEDAEDIMQEVFVKVFKSLSGFKEESEFSTWLYRIAYNTTLSELRKKKMVLYSFENNFSNPENEDIDIHDDIDDVSTEEQIQYLEQAIKMLNSDEALIITLFYLDDQSIEQISKVTNLTIANVKVKLHRIRKKLAIEINKLIEG
ncbi:MAG: sigma-70 family RNA polymerase sigma factor [Dysgonamonadaceae bacterium]|jgi:RNA polymerase sigma-70 factor (ECF subfamily)|nr:sigma-70 family RNA polymerase sigma factor [Dysgonamonadaceae bacterium]